MSSIKLSETKLALWLTLIRQKQTSFLGGSLITVVTTGLSTVISGVTSIIVARALGSTEFGRLLLFTIGINTLALFADVIGIYYANAYLLASQDFNFPLPVIRGTVLAYGALVGLLTGWLFSYPLLHDLLFHGLDGWTWTILLILGLTGQALLSQIRGLFLGFKNFLGLGLVGLTQITGYAALSVIAVYGLHQTNSQVIAWSQVASIYATLSLFLVHLIWRGIGLPSFAYLRACVRVGWRAAVINWLSFLHTRVDQFMVNSLLGVNALGLYGVAVTVGELLTRVPSMVGFVLFPLIAAEQNRAGVAQQTLRRTFMTIGIVAVIATPVGLFATPLLRLLYGETFVAAAPALQFLLPAITCLAGLYLINNHLAGLGYPLMKLVAMATSLGLNISLNWLLLPRLGIVGASLASSMSYLIWLLIAGGYLLWLAKRPPANLPEPAERLEID